MTLRAVITHGIKMPHSSMLLQNATKNAAIAYAS